MDNREPRDINARLRESAQNKVEAERANSVLEFKKAHKQIEDFEKERKRAGLKAVCSRITWHTTSLYSIATKCKTLIEQGNPPNNETRNRESKNIEKMYNSIRYDFIKTLEISEENFTNLFPQINISLENGSSFTFSIVEIIEQEINMKLYCERFL